MPFLYLGRGRRKGATPQKRDAALALATAEEEFKAQYRRLLPEACEMAAAHVFDEDVEDVVDEAFSDLWTSCYADGKADLEKIDGLFWRILRCRIADYLRNREVRGIKEGVDVIDITPHLERQPDIEKQLEEEDFEKEIAMIVATMPKMAAKAFLLARKHDWNARAVAEELGIEHNTVRWHLTRAYTLVRENLARSGYPVPTALPKGRRMGRES